jgi:hypothetical protein
MSTVAVDTIETLAGDEHARLVQVVSTITGTVATGTTQIPWDDTPPLSSEGTEFMTRTITPTNTNNTLVIEVSVGFMDTVAINGGFALFKDSDASAIAGGYYHQSLYEECRCNFTHVITGSLGTSLITFKLRGGGDAAGTFTFNGYAGSTKWNQVEKSTLTISEIRV